MATFLQIRTNGQITLPASIRRRANLKEGDILEVVVDQDGVIHLIPQTFVDRSQAYFWTKRWQQGEEEAEADLQTGRHKDFDNVEDLLSELDEDE
ncbi:MAG: AbrB/MazE/SpoVT family DNA-binding domain-containing protein [Anaerolineales bacterium]|nr:AbrB/MazE/SpoVT family DNA-binding domain-containing protein [Anaerolineales bacterium]